MAFRYLFTILGCLLLHNLYSQNKVNQDKALSIPFDIDKNKTATYEEIRTFYTELDNLSPLVDVNDFGTTDSGQPLQVVVIANDNHFSPEDNRKAGKTLLFINNGIHPGEPDGIDAAMLFAREFVKNPKSSAILKSISIVIIPVYNIDGCINRSSTSRANQNGPEAYGFRANAKNLDLNRDFIKCDSKNAISFNQIFNYWQPDVMIDTHTSNGADYPYTMTLIATQKDKLHPLLSEFMTQNMLPYLYKDMDKKGWEMTPYVFSRGLPDLGIYGFMDTPRYSSGYAALHHTISFMPETHMLKPYKDRVESTLEFLKSTTEYLFMHGTQLAQIRKEVRHLVKNQQTFPLNYTINTQKADSLLFKGYTASYKKSEVSGLERLYYDRNKPWQKVIPYFNHYLPETVIKKPFAYIVPQAYDKIIELMKINGVNMHKLTQDTTLDVEMYLIEKFDTAKNPYEGHYNHSQTEVSTFSTRKKYYKGDYLIYTHQESNRYIVETLEPQATDSWFNWNFFDGILAQKEYFSDYVFEDLAADILNKNPEIRTKLENKKLSDEKFASDGRAQLDFVYKNSPYYEPTHNLYPVARLINP
ncbi:MAG: hypothetical protein IPN86_00950 [Saprospiraceae bacterium]|nr:hypothetical protein [Saprospiraceae bacterium]